MLRGNPNLSYDNLAERLDVDRGTITRNIAKLRKAGILRRVGSKKTGHWEIIGGEA